MQTRPEPPFVSECEEFKSLRQARTDDAVAKFGKSRAEQGFTLLKEIMRKRFGHTRVSILVNTINENIDESARLSRIIAEIASDTCWTNNTVKNKFQSLKHILKSIAISDDFVSRLAYKINDPTPQDRYALVAVAGRKFADLPHGHAVKTRLEQWVQIILQHTKNRCPISIKAIIAFYNNKCLPALGLDLENWVPDDAVVTPELVQNTCVMPKHFGWFDVLCKHILLINPGFPIQAAKKTCKPFDQEFTSGDQHTIPASELDRLHTETFRSDTLDRLIFLLFITTGMRVGGLVKIKLIHVCRISKNCVDVSPRGRTLEKGNKWFEFSINSSVAELIEEWVVKHRRGASEFLFPTSSAAGHLSTNAVRKRFAVLCQKAGLTGPHLHPHALRHSYAHILLNCGNDVTTISKLLNHAGTHITEKYYLKESIDEVVHRATIPWLDRSAKPAEVIPKFLTRKQPERKSTNKRLSSLQTLMTDLPK